MQAAPSPGLNERRKGAERQYPLLSDNEYNVTGCLRLLLPFILPQDGLDLQTASQGLER